MKKILLLIILAIVALGAGLGFAAFNDRRLITPDHPEEVPPFSELYQSASPELKNCLDEQLGAETTAAWNADPEKKAFTGAQMRIIGSCVVTTE